MTCFRPSNTSSGVPLAMTIPNIGFRYPNFHQRSILNYCIRGLSQTRLSVSMSTRSNVGHRNLTIMRLGRSFPQGLAKPSGCTKPLSRPVRPGLVNLRRSSLRALIRSVMCISCVLSISSEPGVCVHRRSEWLPHLGMRQHVQKLCVRYMP